MTKKTGILLINLGTPDAASPAAIKRYLRQFLNDKRVIDLPWSIRWPLVNLLIIPFRFKSTTEAYSKVWSDVGSPLLRYTDELSMQLQKRLGSAYVVSYGMRYGKPSIKQALEQLSECDSIHAIPLFPQYSSAATGSALEELYTVMCDQQNLPSIKVTHDFYNHEGFINAAAGIMRPVIEEAKPDVLLFSYHGLPERHIKKSGCDQVCANETVCPKVEIVNRYCYRAQCFATSKLIAEKLNLAADSYRVSFQSRLGRTPWITPYTDILLPELIKSGKKHLAVVCPSFVADCLETLEEINMRAREQWLSLGGETFTYIPCVNDSPDWVAALEGMVKQ